MKSDNMVADLLKARRQLKLRGQHISLLQAKLFQWNQALIEAAQVAGYSLKYDDPDHDFMSGYPPGLYPSHIVKLLEHVVDTHRERSSRLLAATSNQDRVSQLLADKARLVGQVEVLENENRDLAKHLLNLTKAVRGTEVAEAANAVVGEVFFHKESDPEYQDLKREHLTDLLKTLVSHGVKCWAMRKNTPFLTQSPAACEKCVEAVEEWEPCPYCCRARSHRPKLKHLSCPKCAKYPVPGWRERKR